MINAVLIISFYLLVSEHFTHSLSFIPRFYTLETVARMPYFSYISMLQLYETLGWWRRSSEAKRIHFAEEYNEFNHLLIMEALGGDQEWRVRFFAQHAAVAYYFILIAVWASSPTLAYNFSELIEAHAVDTYEEFAESNKELLQSLEAPAVAKEYYENNDLYIFDEFQTDIPKGTRRPEVYSLYDVFQNIKDDEAAHVSTMNACQNPYINVVSSNSEAALIKEDRTY
jgi:ubiquinol oxidase